MYFFNARFKFKLPPLPTPISGSVVAASAISAIDLQRRKFGDHSHFARRLLDPQLYMASVDPALDPKTVEKLAAYPWFHGRAVPKYDSGQHKNRKNWKAKFKPQLVSMWTRETPSDPAEVRKAARGAVEFQVRAGWEGIILAGPLTTIADQTLQAEQKWIDAGLDACKDLKVNQPVFATIAISEALLHIPALKNQIVHSLSNVVATRAELSGAYVVLEQSDPEPYFWSEKDPLTSLLVIVDDLHRGAKKRVIVNYVGTFGLVAKAAGADLWASGYYLTQRRFSLKAKMGRAHPRYHSFALAGDVGLRNDLTALRLAGLTDELMTPTDADDVLRAAMKRGKTPEDVPQWRYAQSNCAAAQEHYLELVSKFGSQLDAMSDAQRRDWVGDWLRNAVRLVDLVKQRGPAVSTTDLQHQRVWLDVFEWWRNYAKQ